MFFCTNRPKIVFEAFRVLIESAYTGVCLKRTTAWFYGISKKKFDPFFATFRPFLKILCCGFPKLAPPKTKKISTTNMHHFISLTSPIDFVVTYITGKNILYIFHCAAPKKYTKLAKKIWIKSLQCAYPQLRKKISTLIKKWDPKSSPDLRFV